jgi:hypothetical protein
MSITSSNENELIIKSIKHNFITIDLQNEFNLFNRPHNLGELLWIDRVVGGHNSPKGYKITGEKIFESMVNKGFFSKD